MTWLSFYLDVKQMDARYEIHMFWYVLAILIFATINIQLGIWQYLRYKRQEIREKYRDNEQ